MSTILTSTPEVTPRIAPYMAERKSVIDAIDLEPIKYKLIKEEGWSLEKADAVEKQYKGYLWLFVVMPGETHVPTLAIDEMWHTHVLDTEKYMADCFRMFGYYLHHYPYLGLKDQEDRAETEKKFLKTRETYAAVLGFDMYSSLELADCGGGGGGGGCGGGSSCSSSSCSSPSPSPSPSPASCSNYVPASSCVGSGGHHDDNKKKKEEEKAPPKGRWVWIPGLNLDSWRSSVSPFMAGAGYRPGRSEVEALAQEKSALH